VQINAEFLVCYHHNILWIHRQLFVWNNKFEIEDLLSVELVFVEIQTKLCADQNLDYSSNVIFVLLESRAIDKNIVEVRRAEDIQKESQRIVDEILKNRWDVCESERDYQNFEQLLSCSKCCFSFVLFRHSQKIVGVSNVQDCIHQKKIKIFWDSQNWSETVKTVKTNSRSWTW
jgi:hypothetical protein